MNRASRFNHVPAKMTAHLDRVMERWLGWSLPSAALAIAESGWKRDRPVAYCARCGDSVGPGEADASGCASCRD